MSLFATRGARLRLGVVAVLSVGLFASTAILLRHREFLPDPRYDALTYVAPSTIPGAGDGLFAARDIAEGEVIAELGGEAVFARAYPKDDTGYLVAPNPCAHDDLWPFDTLDARRVGGRGAKINFGPRVLNGVETTFQNAQFLEICRRPYVHSVASRAIKQGAEILTSYGETYDYHFMSFPSVRDHFCRAAGQDCSSRYEWEP